MDSVSSVGSTSFRVLARILTTRSRTSHGHRRKRGRPPRLAATTATSPDVSRVQSEKSPESVQGTRFSSSRTLRFRRDLQARAGHKTDYSGRGSLELFRKQRLRASCALRANVLTATL